MSPSWFLNGWSIMGLVALGLLLLLAPFVFSPKPFLEADLVSVTGTVVRVENQKGHRGDIDLVVTVRDGEVRFFSSSPYPSKFRHGSRTPSEIHEGDFATFLLNPSELARPPKRNHVHDFLWREFVGLNIAGTVLLDPKDHEKWHAENQQIGVYVYLGLCVCSLGLIFQGYRARMETRPRRRLHARKPSPKFGRQ